MRNPIDAWKEQRSLILDYKRSFSTPQGKNVLFDLMNRFHVLNELPVKQSEFDRGVEEGKRRAALHILKQCNVSVKRLDEMMKGQVEDHDSNG